MRRAFGVTAVAAAILLLTTGPSTADADAGAGAGGYIVKASTGGGPAPAPTSAPSPAADVPPVRYYSCAEHQMLCIHQSCPAGSTSMIEVSTDADNNAIFPVVCVRKDQLSIASAAAHAFRRIPVPTPTLHIQPVKGTTLVNFKTNFYATGGATFTRTVHLLGQAVTLRVHVQTYDFHFADGHSLTTTSPGAGYPRLTNTHQYLHKGTVHPYLSTTWAADYKVGNGTWQTVSGTVTRTGPTQHLRIITATPVLTGSDG